jgi:saccharopepsin
VTLRGEDYVRKLQKPRGCPDSDSDECYVMIDFLGSMEDLIILGMPFLEKVMGVFNWDEKTVSCESSYTVRGIGCLTEVQLEN